MPLAQRSRKTSELQNKGGEKGNLITSRGGAGDGHLLPAVLNSAQPLSGSSGPQQGKETTVSPLNQIPRQSSLLSMVFVPDTQLFLVFPRRDKDAQHSSLHLSQPQF